MARNRAQAGAKAAAEARKRMAKTVQPAERALAAWIEAVAAEHAAPVDAITNLAKLAELVGVDQAAALTELTAEAVLTAQTEAATSAATQPLAST